MYALVEYLIGKNKVHRCLVFCPRPSEWVLIFNKFVEGRTILVYQGTVKQREELRDLYRESPTDYIVATSGIALQRKDMAFFLEIADNKTILVMDEAHKIKSRTSRRAGALKAIGRAVRNRYALTATGIYNRADDLFGILEWVNPDILGAWRGFSAKYLRTDHYGGIVGYQDLDILHERVAPVVARKDYDDVDVLEQLPSLTMSSVLCTPAREQASLLAKVTKMVIEEIDELVGSTNWSANTYRDAGVFKILTALDQVGIWPELLPEDMFGDDIVAYARLGKLMGKTTGAIKLETAVDLIKDMLEDGRSMIVFCRYLKPLHEYLAKEILAIQGEVFLYTGSVAKKDDILRDFRVRAGIEPIVLLASDAGGESINVPECSCVINIDVPWGYAQLYQRIHRVRRIDSSDYATPGGLSYKGHQGIGDSSQSWADDPDTYDSEDGYVAPTIPHDSCPGGMWKSPDECDDVQEEESRGVIAFQMMVPGLDEYKSAISGWKKGVARAIIDGEDPEEERAKPKLRALLESAVQGFSQSTLDM